MADYAKFAKNEKLIIQKIDTLSYQILRFGNSGVNSAIEKGQISRQIDFSGLNNTDSTTLKISKKLEDLFRGFLVDKVINQKDDSKFDELRQKIQDKEDEIKDLKDELKDMKDCARQSECGC